eukprot:Gregarina_sp_Poly_1__4589@NODE_245_length_10761_cov_123_252572_g215_i0_p1_GENE_NODE_245_length_10761_cov_123_252572_g215_i0NODE_245_length_10761_cov_123_252572_g215_i0_p1_ORF_typecomplete_len1510_score242_75UCH/PF00443_29/1_1e68UCH_1/PF13423_6/2_8e19USP7_C2/PF14533_6/0_0001_NODE_245_length_10761_cov_123_252572_g215_i044278956
MFDGVSADSLKGGVASSVGGDSADSLSTQQANESESCRSPLHTPAPWAGVRTHAEMLPLESNEATLILPSWKTATADRIVSPPIVIGNRLRCQLVVFPRELQDSTRTSTFLQVLEPPCVTQEKERCGPAGASWGVDKWICSEVLYYICVHDFSDWRRSPFVTDKWTFTKESPERGWLAIASQPESMERCTGPDGEMVWRFGVQAGNLFWRDSDVGRRGLRNHGTTCYLNSLLQCLYQVGGFRKAVFETTVEEDNKIVEERRRVECGKLQDTSLETAATMSDTPKGSSAIDGIQLLEEYEKGISHEHGLANDDADSIALNKYAAQQVAIGDVLVEASDRNNLLRALQKIFYALGDGGAKSPVPCEDLLVSFGWNSADLFTQHDAQELNRLLCDRLEEKMKGTVAEGSIKKLFGGELEVFIKCLDVPYESKRKEVFYDLQLDIQNLESIGKSLNKYVEVEVLDGDNKYHAEGHGPQRAKKGVRFLKFPPVLQFHLKRFEFDLQTMDMIKLDDHFEFPEAVNFDDWCPNAGEYRLFAVDVHQGDVHQGHYYTFIKTFDSEDLRSDLWLKFDDENVCLVDKYTAVDSNYGGRMSTLSIPFLESLRDCVEGGPRHMSMHRQCPTFKHYSAYILFYIKSDLITELLTCPLPAEVNPGMALRCELQDALMKRKESERRRKEETLVIKFITETDLMKRPKGFWSSSYTLPVRKSIRRSRKMPAYEFWGETIRMIEAGKLGADLQAQYSPAGVLTRLPALYYVEYAQQLYPKIPYAQCGWSADYCNEQELGTGLKLWYLEMQHSPDNRSSCPVASDLGHNLGYLNPDPPDADVLHLLILPIPMDYTPASGALLSIQELTKCLEQYTPSPVKIFDASPARAQDQNVYFVGFIDVLARPEATIYDRIQHSVVSKLVFAWKDPAKRDNLLAVMPSSSSLPLALDKLVADLGHRFITERDGTDVVDLSRSRLSLNLWIEHRGYVQPIGIAASHQDGDIDGRIIIFQWATDKRADMEALQAYQLKVQALCESFPKEPDISQHEVQTKTFFSGEPTPWPAVLDRSDAMSPETVIQNVPPLYSQSVVFDWLSQLRQERQLHVEIFDVAQHLGRWEGLKGQCFGDRALDMEEMLLAPSSSDGGSVEPVKQITVPIHLNWQEGVFFEWLTTTVLNCDSRYLAWYQCRPFESPQDVYMSPYEHDLYRESPEPQPLACFRQAQEPKKRFIRVLFGRLCKNHGMTTAGASPLLSSCCAEPVSQTPPTLTLGLLPRAFTPLTNYLWIRVFSNDFGSVGVVLIDNFPKDKTLEDLVKETKARMDPTVIAERVDSYPDFINQDFDLVEFSSASLRRYNMKLRWHETKSLVSTLSFSRQLRVEPVLRWLPLCPNESTPTNLIAVDFIHVDVATERSFGFPFSMLIAADELVISIKERMAKHFGRSLGSMHGVKWYRSEQLSYNNDKLLKILQDGDILITKDQVQGLSQPALAFQSSRHPHLPFFIVLKHPVSDGETLSSKTARRRANHSLHISS